MQQLEAEKAERKQERERVVVETWTKFQSALSGEISEFFEAEKAKATPNAIEGDRSASSSKTTTLA
jgi:hypothetical protein